MDRPSSIARFTTVPATLYTVATPIGNLGDMTKRAIEVLQGVDVIACEDTRVTAKLATIFAIDTPLMAYHDHNGESARPRILEKLKEGRSVALVSDAGTPLISDPGFKLVAAVQDAGFSVVPVPGASALTAALSAAGLATDRFSFHGFLPAKQGPRKAMLEALKAMPDTLIFYESTRRLTDFLKDAFTVLGDRQACVAREMTKQFEEVVRNDLSGLLAEFSARDSIKGECVVLIEGHKPDDEKSSNTKVIELELEGFYSLALKSLRVKEAAALACDLFGGSKKDHYAALQSIKDGDN